MKPPNQPLLLASLRAAADRRIVGLTKGGDSAMNGLFDAEEIEVA